MAIGTIERCTVRSDPWSSGYVVSIRSPTTSTSDQGIVNGFATERYGYRIVCIGSLIWLAAVTTIFFTAPNIQTLLAAEILAGVPWGVFQASKSPIPPFRSALVHRS